MQPQSLPQSPISEAQTVSPTHYTWRNYRCAYEVHVSPHAFSNEGTHLLLIHPIGVGLSRHFWQRFCRNWFETGHHNPIYNPDLLGCGGSDMPHIAYSPVDWAEQLYRFLQTVVQKPVVLLVQGALLPVAIALTQHDASMHTNFIKGLVLAGPPAWAVITDNPPAWQQRLTWNLLDSSFGTAFYLYARRPQFLRSFSTRQLFADAKQVDDEWLQMLVQGATDVASRYAVFSFLAGFWRQDYGQAIAAITQPTLVVVGEEASSISQTAKKETPDQRLADYLEHLQQGQGLKTPGRNVLPYESTSEFVAAIAPFVDAC